MAAHNESLYKCSFWSFHPFKTSSKNFSYSLLTKKSQKGAFASSPKNHGLTPFKKSNQQAHPSHKPTFCPKWKVVSILGQGRGRWVFFQNLILIWPINRAFSHTWPATMQIYWNKRKRLHKKRVQFPQDWFGTPTRLPFYCFGTPIWPS